MQISKFIVTKICNLTLILIYILFISIISMIKSTRRLCFMSLKYKSKSTLSFKF